MRRYLTYCLVVIFSFLIANMLGCAAKNRGLSYYSFDYPSPTREAENPVRETLMIYRFLLSRNVPIDSLVISIHKGAEETQKRYQWKENPADMISELVLRDMQTSGLFEKAVDQLSNLRYRYSLEGAITTLKGFVRDGAGKGVLEMEVMLTDFEAPPGADKGILKKTYLIEVPSSDTSPEAIIKALNLAVKELSQRLRSDVRLALEHSGALQKIDPEGHSRPREVQCAGLSDI